MFTHKHLHDRIISLCFYVYALFIVVCPFVLFILPIVLSVLLRFTDSDYLFGIFKLFSLIGEVLSHKTSLTPPLFIDVPVPSHEMKRSFICVLGVSMLPLDTILLFDLWIVPAVWYFTIWLVNCSCSVIFYYLTCELFLQCDMFTFFFLFIPQSCLQEDAKINFISVITTWNHNVHKKKPE